MATKKIFTWKDPRAATLAVKGMMAFDIAWIVLGLVIESVWGNLGHLAAVPASNLGNETLPLIAFGALSFGLLLNLPVVVWWIIRASRNAHVLKGRPLESSPIFAALWWYIIPIASLYKPVQAMAEIWDESASSRERRSRNKWLLAVWWPALLITGVSAKLSGMDEIAEAATTIALLSALVQATAFLLLTRQICAMQREKEVAITFSDEGLSPGNVPERQNA